jgi:hypothetical protein
MKAWESETVINFSQENFIPRVLSTTRQEALGKIPEVRSGCASILFAFCFCLCLFLFPLFPFVSFSLFCFGFGFFRFFVYLSQTQLPIISPPSTSAQIVSSVPHHLSTPSLPILASRMPRAQMHHSTPNGGAYSML